MQLQYFRPDSLEPALNWLIESDARIAAGCTDLLPATTAPGLSGPVLDLTAISGLRGISQDDQNWRFGATTTWTDVVKAELPAAFDSLKLAAKEVGSIQIQNAGTLAGNLCNASPAADGVPCWLTMNAQVELQSREGTRHLPLGSFIKGPGKTDLKRGEIVSAILVPKSASLGRSSFLKLGARKYLIISIAMVAARIHEKDGLISQAAVSVGACNAVAQRLTDVENHLIGKPISEHTANQITDEMMVDVLHPIDDLRSDASYRLTAASELVRRCIGSIVAERTVSA